MKIRSVYYSSHFEKAFKSLPLNVRKQAIEKEKIFLEKERWFFLRIDVLFLISWKSQL